MKVLSVAQGRRLDAAYAEDLMRRAHALCPYASTSVTPATPRRGLGNCRALGLMV